MSPLVTVKLPLVTRLLVNLPEPDTSSLKLDVVLVPIDTFWSCDNNKAGVVEKMLFLISKLPGELILWFSKNQVVFVVLLSILKEGTADPDTVTILPNKALPVALRDPIMFVVPPIECVVAL
jgi:hypothetical protein